MSNLDQHNVQVFGITSNDAESHQKFSEENKLNFPLLLDTDRNLALLYGATDKLEGRFNRITIVIDKSGKIIQIDKDVNPDTQGPDLVNFIKTQKTN